MPLIQWGPQYAVGHPEIDAQHEQLVAIINRLHDEMGKGRGREAMARVVHELDDYTRTHFAAEEVLMERHGYPDMAAHKEQHLDFIGALFDMVCKVESGKGSVSLDALKYLRGWLIGHIGSVDRRFATFLADRK